jgi:AcrR family transcriptional regulator
VREPEHRFGPFAPAALPERARIRLALIDAALRRGLPAVTIDQLCREAGVERATFERDFAGVTDCATQVYLANIAEFDRRVFGAVERASGWPERLRVAAYAAARHVRDRPRESRFDFIEMLEVGVEAQAHRDRYLRRIVALIDEGRQVAPDPAALGPGVAEAAFGAVYETLAKTAGAGSGFERVESHVPELMYVAVRPYLGHEAALRELEIPAPPEDGGGV